MGVSRRVFITRGVGGAAVLMVQPGSASRAFAGLLAPSIAQPVPGGTIDKYQTPLIVPPAMPRAGRIPRRGRKPIDVYEIAVRQFDQQILPPGAPTTTVWSYGSAAHAGTFNYPAFTIEAKWRSPVRVRWINDLKDPLTGRFLSHLLPVDPTVHWANPPGGAAGRDTEPTFTETPGPYTGPVPLVTHLHGGENVAQESDGFAEAWFLPDAADIPDEYARTGTYYDEFVTSSRLGGQWRPGSAVFEYPNEQRASTLWFHDHTLGMTRVNVYAGPAGFYLLRGGPSDAVGGVLPGPAPALGDPPGMSYYEIPLAIQDRSFNGDGSLFYADSREYFDGFAGPYIPASDIAPIFNPEFFGNTIVVNGRTWPYLEVEQRRYRFRILNGCNSRFLILRLSNGLPFWVIGSDGGFLPAPVELDTLLIGPAERNDVIVDFTTVPVGTEIIVENLGPDEPFGGGEPDEDDFTPADPNTTGQVMQLRVVPAKGRDRSTPPSQLVLPSFTPLGPATGTRQVSLNEVDSVVLPGIGPRAALLGTLDATGAGVIRGWGDTISENPAVGSTEVWEMYNFTEDAHPIHIHEVQFQVVDRQPIDGAPRPPEPWETGFKDTVVAYPGEITRVKVHFGIAGLFVWHCHIVEHEDHEMMRPYRIGDGALDI